MNCLRVSFTHLPVRFFALFLLNFRELFIWHHFTCNIDCKYFPPVCHLSFDSMLCPEGVCSLGKEEGKRKKPAVLPQLCPPDFRPLLSLNRPKNIPNQVCKCPGVRETGSHGDQLP